MAKRRRGLGSSGNANELRLYIENDGALYRQMLQPIQKNLCKKKRNGTFKASLAPKAFMHLMNAGAKKYACEMATCKEWNKLFSVADRKNAARWSAEDFEADSSICRESWLTKAKRRVGIGWGDAVGVAGVRKRRRSRKK